jgi:hypothetical protein
VKQLALLTAALILVSGHTYGDSIFDVRGTGRDIIPVTGAAAAMGGAVAASKDPLSPPLTPRRSRSL